MNSALTSKHVITARFEGTIFTGMRYSVHGRGIPACTWAGGVSQHAPGQGMCGLGCVDRRPLKQTVRILLECILGSSRLENEKVQCLRSRYQ